MARLIVDQETCIGCGTCVALCSKVFQLGENGKAKVINQEGATKEEIQNAISSCPTASISWKEK